MTASPESNCAWYSQICDSHSGELTAQDRALYLKSCEGRVEWEADGAKYCVMHAPTTEKLEAFRHHLNARLAARNYEFHGAWFPEHADFEGIYFGSRANFSSAVFQMGAVFKDARFNIDAIFAQAKFNAGNADFTKARFGGAMADFSNAEFHGDEAIFHEANFPKSIADFSRTGFYTRSVSFAGVKFSGELTNFGFAYFEVRRADFSHCKFAGKADFINAVFDAGPDFGGSEFYRGGYFLSAVFGGFVSFKGVRFDGEETFFNGASFTAGAIFDKASFKENVHFNESKFALFMDFDRAVFEKQVFFDKAIFAPESFSRFQLARFADLVRFVDVTIGDKAELYFGEATFEKPDRVFFHSIPNLRPRWFINVDTRKFNFENADFPILDKKTVREFFTLASRAQRELDSKEDFWRNTSTNPKAGVKDPDKLLTTAYQRLGQNAEENNRYWRAMGFRYLAMETHRQAARWRRYLPVTLHWWYWASSGYGERAVRAVAMLLLVWLVPLAFYASPFSEFLRLPAGVEVKQTLERYPDYAAGQPANLPAVSANDRLFNAALYSINVMTFQKPEPKPAETGRLTRVAVLLQTILGPLQAALLALAIRRKFMR